jgi:hypothetical protein
VLLVTVVGLLVSVPETVDPVGGKKMAVRPRNPETSNLGLVRTRLAAGGRWIRTIGTAYETTLMATPFGPSMRLPRHSVMVIRLGSAGRLLRPGGPE